MSDTMAGYKCAKCEEDIDVDPVNEKIICPRCSGRVILKKRPQERTTVKAE
ncbi:MAG: DNA-directed RNA polymerase subunit P [Candidatus Nanohaloarchaeota archaeon QJJ-5]|nr:DNA-directed RNA polymerase subunit P [Candidatus Nanohaloarchaeota archaeon QJJ-5]